PVSSFNHRLGKLSKGLALLPQLAFASNDNRRGVFELLAQICQFDKTEFILGDVRAGRVENSSMNPPFFQPRAAFDIAAGSEKFYIRFQTPLFQEPLGQKRWRASQSTHTNQSAFEIARLFDFRDAYYRKCKGVEKSHHDSDIRTLDARPYGCGSG